MNIVNELQISAQQDDVLTVLRKAKRLASKLSRQDISEWLHAELNGYDDGQVLPEYRVVDTILAFNTSGTVSPGLGFLAGEITPLPYLRVLRFPMRESIGALLPVINDLERIAQSCLYRSIEDGDASIGEIGTIIAKINLILSQPAMFLLHPNRSQIRAIPERIKDKVLHWALELEAAGVLGEGSSFTEAEKASANVVVFNFSSCTIEQLTNLGTNQRG